MFWKKIASFIFAHFFLFGFNTKVFTSSTPPPTATTSLAIASSTSPAATSTPIISKTASSTPKSKSIAAKKVAPPIAATSTSATPQPTQVVPDFVAINEFTRRTIVNILCTTKGGELSPISGTGVLVGSQGLILTNAHLGQYFLLKDFRQKDFIECVARTGSPAYPKYHLELVYISPTWVANNKTLLKEQNPLGTGENDFAFLRITDSIDGTALPDKFPYLAMDIREVIGVGEPVLLASYPAGFLGGLSILQDLSITTAITNVADLFTYKDRTIDLISVPGTVVSQKGSSGGAVVDGGATLIGIISTSSNGDTTSQRDLRAITLAYINRDLQSELGVTLAQFVSQDMAAFAKKFQEINVPSLSKLIEDELNKN